MDFPANLLLREKETTKQQKTKITSNNSLTTKEMHIKELRDSEFLGRS